MADTKISALPASTTPLAGTEVLPIVQSGTTKNVSVNNLTSGRDIPVLGVVGTTTDNNATAGSVGEYVSSTVASAGVSLAASGTVYNVTSISLTAGDWDVSGVVAYTSSTGLTTFEYIQSSISTTSATSGPNGSLASGSYGNATVAAIVDFTQQTPLVRISLAATTTVYLTARASYGVTAPSAYGAIRARRVR